MDLWLPPKPAIIVPKPAEIVRPGSPEFKFSPAILPGLGGARAGVASAAAPLDALSASAAGAYGFYKLRTAYAGNCLKVRRSSDSTTQDIGFSSGELDTAAIASFCGAGNGFVDTLYDQVGSKNFVQATTANQPQIYNGSATITGINSKPTGQWDGSNDSLQCAASSTVLTPANSAFTFFAVWRPTAYPAAGNENDIAGVGNVSHDGFGCGYDDTPRVVACVNTPSPVITGIPAAPVSDMIMVRTSALTSGTAATIYRNGSGSTATGNWTLTASGASDTMSMGSSFRPHFFTGYMAEIYFFASQLSQADANLLGQAAATRYGLTWTNI